MIKLLLIGTSLVAQVAGILLFKESFATTPTTTTANPYQSAQYQVEVTIPEPAQSILRFGGLGLALVVSPGLLFCGISATDKKKTVREVFDGSARSAQPQPEFRSVVQGRKAPVEEYPEVQQSKQFDFDFNQLEESDPYENVKSLVYENSVVFCGFEKGSGKTEKLGWLVSQHLKLGHLCASVSAFATADQGKGILVFGRQNNVHDIAKGCRWFIELNKTRIANRGAEGSTYNPMDDIHVHFSCDEITNWANIIPDLYPGLMTELWDVFSQYCRQANTSFALATHGETLAALGGKELSGKSETIKNGVVFVYPKAQTDPSIPGGKRCAGWAELRRPGSKELVQIKIPDWMKAPDKHDYTQIIMGYCPKLLYLKQGQKQETKIEINPQSSVYEQADSYRQGLDEQSDLLKSLRDRINQSELE